MQFSIRQHKKKRTLKGCASVGHVCGHSVMPAASIKRVSPHTFSGIPMLDYRFFLPLPKSVFGALKRTTMVPKLRHHNAFK
jgi:hypothetical protein